ncbi:relaxase, partial [Escherichia coli]|nr:relaxase [Escherichia coli]
NGRKAEREYTRDELDHRFIIDGDLATTNKIIESIEDKGQERYLHITLSFAENEISEETLKNVTSDFRKMLMNAYHTDEYAFYAEAHLPKIKNIVDNKTGELVERKPHIHIVIPRTNLVTGNSLNPPGDLTNLKTQTQLDSVQEYLNNKYNLISPKDSVRVSDENYANVLSRVKGDLYRERN